MTERITREEIVRNLDARVPMTLVEALPLNYFAAEHLPGAININFDEVEQIAPRVLTDKDRLIVVYCSNLACPNSQKAAAKLTALGYTNVRKYAEGKQDWAEAGLATERSKDAA
jgi:rhodanese-related sulfurtransferase